MINAYTIEQIINSPPYCVANAMTDFLHNRGFYLAWIKGIFSSDWKNVQAFHVIKKVICVS